MNTRIVGALLAGVIIGATYVCYTKKPKIAIVNFDSPTESDAICVDGVKYAFSVTNCNK